MKDTPNMIDEIAELRTLFNRMMEPCAFKLGDIIKLRAGTATDDGDTWLHDIPAVVVNCEPGLTTRTDSNMLVMFRLSPDRPYEITRAHSRDCELVEASPPIRTRNAREARRRGFPADLGKAPRPRASP